MMNEPTYQKNDPFLAWLNVEYVGQQERIGKFPLDMFSDLETKSTFLRMEGETNGHRSTESNTERVRQIRGIHTTRTGGHTMSLGEFLNEEDAKVVDKIAAYYGINSHGDFGGYVQIWGRRQAIQLDGDFTTKELKCLLQISEYLEIKEVT